MRIRILLVAAVAMLLCGCSREAPEPTLMTVEIPEPTQPLTVAPETHPDTAEYYISNVYSEQLGQYYRALLERWGPEQFEQQGRSPLGAAYLQGDPLENVGFGFVDLDNDGRLELIIGAILNAEKDPSVFEIWTLVDGEPVMLAQGGSRNRYVLQYVEEDRMWYVVNEGSNGAANSATHYLMLNEGKLDVPETLLKAVNHADGPEAERLTQLKSSHGQFKSALDRANNLKRRQNCEGIPKLLEEIPDSAEGMRSSIQDIWNNCQKELSSAPSRL
jgi:hypothetical protein